MVDIFSVFVTNLQTILCWKPMKLEIDHMCKAGAWPSQEQRATGTSQVKKLLQPRKYLSPTQPEQWVARIINRLSCHSKLLKIINKHPVVSGQVLSSHHEGIGSTWLQLCLCFIFSFSHPRKFKGCVGCSSSLEH